MENEIIKVEETEKEWTLVGEIPDWEAFFMDERNFLPVLEFAKERARGLVADPTTKDGQIARKSLAKRIGQVEKAIAERGLEVARVLKEKPKKIDAVRKRVKETLIMYKEEVLAPLKEIEARQAEIEQIAGLPATGIGCDSYALRDLIGRLDDWEAKDWKESATVAFEAIKIARAQLNSMLTSVEKSEADAKELEELRKRQAEFEAAEKAKAEAELRKAQEEAARAKAEADEAKRKAEQAEAEKVAAQKAQQDAEAMVPEWKKSAIPDEQQLFPEDIAEKKRRYNREALAELVKYTEGDETLAKAIITAIARDQIPHVFIDYGSASVDF